jgi:hypothetical protein
VNATEPRGGPAFPRTGFECDREERGSYDTAPQAGMTLRDYFAAKAMQSLVHEGWKDAVEIMSLRAYRIADAMLEAREQ